MSVIDSEYDGICAEHGRVPARKIEGAWRCQVCGEPVEATCPAPDCANVWDHEGPCIPLSSSTTHDSR